MEREREGERERDARARMSVCARRGHGAEVGYRDRSQKSLSEPINLSLSPFLFSHVLSLNKSPKIEKNPTQNIVNPPRDG